MINIIISGQVQGVGFRQFVKYNANKLNIKGWVKNLPSGDVQALLVGDDENLKKMIETCKKGPFLAKVENIKMDKLPNNKFESFEIVHE